MNRPGSYYAERRSYPARQAPDDGAVPMARRRMIPAFRQPPFGGDHAPRRAGRPQALSIRWMDDYQTDDVVSALLTDPGRPVRQYSRRPAEHYFADPWEDDQFNGTARTWLVASSSDEQIPGAAPSGALAVLPGQLQLFGAQW